jgi:hypothetical protein
MGRPHFRMTIAGGDGVSFEDGRRRQNEAETPAQREEERS